MIFVDPFYHGIHHRLVGIVMICFPTTSRNKGEQEVVIQRLLKDKPVDFWMIFTPLKFKMDTKNDGLEKVSPFEYGNFG